MSDFDDYAQVFQRPMGKTAASIRAQRKLGKKAGRAKRKPSDTLKITLPARVENLEQADAMVFAALLGLLTGTRIRVSTRRARGPEGARGERWVTTFDRA